MDSLGRGGPPSSIPDLGSLGLTYEEIADGELIGQGGNADVFRVTVRRDAREIPVAVKQPRLQGTLNSETVERFVQEADVWAELDGHDHVVSLYDWGADPLPWLAMEYMDVGTLADLPDGRRLPLDQALWVGVCVCRAMHHAHRHGVAHHDIKPANVLFTSTADGWAAPKISDWGLARLMLEETGSVEGLSPHYAAPEQFDAQQYGSPDDRTDIYQVGTLVYELVTGRPPFEGSATAVMQGVLSEEPQAPSDVADVPAELDEILRRALAKDPADRYESVLYLRDRLQTMFDAQFDGQRSVDDRPRREAGSGAVPTGQASDGHHRRGQPVQTDPVDQQGRRAQGGGGQPPTTGPPPGDAPPPVDQEQPGRPGQPAERDSDSSMVRRGLLGILGLGVVGAGGWQLLGSDIELGGDSGSGDVGPQVSFDYDYNDADADQDPNQLTIKVSSGDPFTAQQVSFTGENIGNFSGSEWQDVATGNADATSSIGAGDRAQATVDNPDFELEMVWTSEDGDDSAILSRRTGPDA